MASYYARGDRPEGALKRAQDLISVGNKADALRLLHESLTAKRHARGGGSQWQQAYEPIMLLYLELCVDLKEHRGAKDGLHQYRNMSQQHGGDSLEKVIAFYVDLSERRCNEARKQADAAALAAASARITDLENDVVPDPEAVMLSTMTMDSEKERADRDIMVPWLKFLWETYRAVLEVLRTMQKLERLYHSTAEKALGFCKSLERTREFRSLCETISNHLGNLLKATQPLSAGGKEHKPKGWEGWTSESIELHLQTRFKQLEVADALRLWNEGFRIVEDIHTLMQIPVRQPDGTLARRQPKPRLMASYYDKMAKIFAVAGNKLFHAYAWHKYYALTREAKSFTAEEKQVQASTVLLAALCVPPTASEDGDGAGGQGAGGASSADAVLNDDMLRRRRRAEKVAALLEFNAHPTRALLIAELLAKGVHTQVLPELRGLYQRVELDFAPLQLIPSLLPTLAFLRSHPKLQAYVPGLERLLVLRTLKQLGGVYHTVRMAHLKSLLAGLELDFAEVEHIIVAAIKERQIKVRVDHQGQCLHFGEAGLEGDASMRHQLQTLAAQLSVVSNQHLHKQQQQQQQQATEGKEENTAAARLAYFRQVLENLEAEHRAVLARKEQIERAKVDKERERQRRREQEALRKQEEEKRRRQHEEQRMEEEKRRREEEQRKRDEEALALETVQSKLKDMGLASKVEDMKALDAEARKRELEGLVAKQAEQKQAEARRLQEQAKRLDYTVRALRLHEQELVDQAYAKQIERTKAEHAAKEAELDAQRRKEFEAALALKRRFAPMLPYTPGFEEMVNKVRRADFEAHVGRMRQEYERAMKQKIQRARKRKSDKEEREAKRNREMEQIRQFEENRLRKIREDRERYQREQAERDAQQRRDEDELDLEGLDEYEDEEEEEYVPADIREAQANGAAPVREPEPEEGGEGRPRKYVPPVKRGEGGGGGGWRERVAAKEKEQAEREGQRRMLIAQRGGSNEEEGEEEREPPRGGGEREREGPGGMGGGMRGPPRFRGAGGQEGGGWRQRVAERGEGGDRGMGGGPSRFGGRGGGYDDRDGGRGGGGGRGPPMRRGGGDGDSSWRRGGDE